MEIYIYLMTGLLIQQQWDEVGGYRLQLKKPQSKNMLHVSCPLLMLSLSLSLSLLLFLFSAF